MDNNIMSVAQSIESYLKIPEESDFLLAAARQAKYGIIEVGSWTGRSSVLLAAMARELGIPFLAVDTWESCDLEPGKDFYPIWKANMVKAGLLEEEFELSPDDQLYSLRCDSSVVYCGDCVSVMRMPSVVAARILPSIPFDHDEYADFDFLFIDADHAYESIKQDFFVWLPNLTKPATVVLHDVDCGHVGVRRFFQELQAAGMETEQAGNIGLVRLR